MNKHLPKFLNRLIYIVGAVLLLWALSFGRISDIPGFDYLVSFLWGGVVVLAVMALGKNKGWWCLLLVLFFGQMTISSAWADSTAQGESVQGYYPTYCAKVEQAKQNHWKGDQKCDEEAWENARYITSSQKGEETVQDTNCTCSSEYDCAKKLMRLCSEYERRHHLENEDNKKVHTVVEILALDDSGCWPCDMAAVIFVVIQNLSFTLNSVMVEVATMLLKLIFFGWIIFTGASAVVFPSKGMTFASQVLIRMICVALVWIVLSTNGMTHLYTNFLNPIMEAGLGLSEKVSDSALPSDTFGAEIDKLVPTTTTSSNTSNDYCTTSASDSFTNLMGGFLGSDLTKRLLGAGTTSKKSSSKKAGKSTYMADKLSGKLVNLEADQETLLNDDMKKELLCMTQKFYKQVRPFTAMGQSLVEFSRKDESSYFGVKFPDLKMWTTGWLLVLIFTIFGFLVAFRIMDIFLRLGLFLVLIPWFVAAIAFPITRDFTKKGWSFFLHTIMEFLGLALAIALVMKMFEQIVSPDSDNLKKVLTASYSEDYGQNLYDVIYSGGAGRFFFMLAVSAYFALEILKMVTPMLEQLFSFKGVSKESIFGNMALTAVQTSSQWARRAGEVASNENMRFKSKDKLKREEIDAMKKELPQLQDDINKKIIQSSSLDKKAASPKATEDDKKKAAQAQAELQEARKKMAEMQAKIAQAEKELKDMSFESSGAKFGPRRYAENSANALHYYSENVSSKIETVLVGTGQWLNKTGIGAIVGTPLVYAGKLASWGLRGSTKTISTTVHAVGATPGAIKGTISAVKNAPKNFVQGVKTRVKNAEQTTKDVLGFTGYVAKKAVFEAPKKAIVSTVKAPVVLVKKTGEVAKDAVGFTGYLAKKTVVDGTKAVVDSVVHAPENFVQGVKDGIEKTGEVAKDTVGFSRYVAKKVVYEAPKNAIKSAVAAPFKLTKKVVSIPKNVAHFSSDLAKKIFTKK